MKIHELSGPSGPELSKSLAEFEFPFTYPLGPGRTFSISHGQDYSLFFRAQGEAKCFIAEVDGKVVGALGTAIRKIILPDGTERLAAYFGDLKIAKDFRGGRVLLRLARAAEKWLRPQVSIGFGVVMGGTRLLPELYTGRAGIPPFEVVGNLAVLRIAVPPKCESIDPARFVTQKEVISSYKKLSLGRYASPVQQAHSRSESTPVWLMEPDGHACGLFEDTRKAKRLIADDGTELSSAHLSCFAYSEATNGANLVRRALSLAHRAGYSALFVSVPDIDAPALQVALSNFAVLNAPATIYGTGLEPGIWNINTSEI